MKKLFLIILLIFLQITAAQALVSSDMRQQSRVTVGGAFNYNNPVRTLPQSHYVNHVVISNSAGTNIITPPPPPPERNKYRYRNFAGDNRFPVRSYYIPSYCMPERNFYYNYNNPFCNHYRPYGSSLYISF